jgi:hypothetical protein
VAVVEHVAKFHQLRAGHIWEILFWDRRSQTSLDRSLQRLVASKHLGWNGRAAVMVAVQRSTSTNLAVPVGGCSADLRATTG